ncbi:MAG: hypothetical protein LBF51_02280 [Zoogloeaceae bacterium]|nr:hypothetical protein [Zoogloeaceae bacterium]
MLKNRKWFALALLLTLGLPFALMSTSRGGSVEWGAVRDGSLYLRPSAPAESVQLRWQAAWQAEANSERVYLLDGNGKLVEQLDIHADQTHGEYAFILKAGNADYRLGIPGYSFRNYHVTHDADTAAQFEPAKVHFCADVPRNSEFYFRVAAGEKAVLGGKHHGGVHALRATRLSDSQTLRLNLQQYAQYSSFDRMPLPESKQDEIWRLTLEGSGKAAFWLDGADNLFAQKPEHLHRLDYPSGMVELTLSGNILGAAPRLGLGLPYAAWPESGFAALDALAPQAANYYSFVDVLPRQPEREIGFRRQYGERFGIDFDLTLLAGSGRRAVLADDQQTLAGVDAWLADSARLKSGGIHYLSLADEPNLNYPDYASFERYFDALVRRVRGNSRARDAGVRIAVPASSRFINGPFHDGDANARRGMIWTERLLRRYENDIDAIVWHEWMVRDLFATRRYRDNVQAAARLVGRDADGRPKKALLLNQTNISSGSSVSVYQQDTNFAALWWASVVINASRDGLLDMLNWFLVADDAGHAKGMLRERGAGNFEPRPVGLAQQFIRNHWLSQVEALDNNAFEVDALAMRDGKRHGLLGVNKSRRLQQISLSGADGLCQVSAKLEFFGSDNRARAVKLDCGGSRPRFNVPGETLFALSWKTP